MVQYSNFPIDVLTIDGAYDFRLFYYDQASKSFLHEDILFGITEYGPGFNNDVVNWTAVLTLAYFGQAFINEVYDAASQADFAVRKNDFIPYEGCALAVVTVQTPIPANIDHWYGSSVFGLFGAHGFGDANSPVGTAQFQNYPTQAFISPDPHSDGFYFNFKENVEAVVSLFRLLPPPPPLGNFGSIDYKPFVPR